MNQSLFPQYVEKFFPNYVLSVTEYLNGRSLNNRALPFLFKQLLTPRYSADGRWASISAQYQNVAADVVALGSETPLKSRDSLMTYVGEIPKLAMKRSLNEVEMKNIDAMLAMNRPEEDIVNRIFSDIPVVINGIDERLEDIFLSMFSSGIGLATNNVGQGVRIDMHYLNSNRKGVSVLWSDPAAKPVTDVVKILDKANDDGNVIRFAYADDTALRNLYSNAEIRGVFGFQQNFVGGGSNVPTLSFDQMRELFLRQWGTELVRVARSTRTEINGKRSPHKAWKNGTVVFCCDERVGDLVYTSTAEETRPVSGVNYQIANGYTLVSQYSEQEPLMEFTKAQAMAVPVINNVDRIYTLDTLTVQA
jgi:hypothetical protein